MRRVVTLGLIAATLVAVGGALAIVGSRGYQVQLVLPSAPGLVAGGVVKVDGLDAGTISNVEPRENRAHLTLELDAEFAPLHDGASVVPSWKAVVGERHLEVNDGAESNATIPDGGMIEASMPEPMEVDRILGALDPTTRERLKSLVKRLHHTLGDSAKDVNETMRTAGPALNALGDVLAQLGNDAPAIKALIRNLDDVIGTLASRDDDIRQIVAGLDAASNATARKGTRLGEALRRLPATLRTADGTLADVPATTDGVTPLLRELQPATRKLPGFASRLRPVLRDLRPTVSSLRQTMMSARELLGYTPGLFDSLHGVLPSLNSTVKDLLPALNFVRPYTPEMVGFFSNWASAAGNYDVNGHYARTSATGGAMTLDANPGIVPPGTEYDPYPAPGAAENQPWHDAFGSGIR